MSKGLLHIDNCRFCNGGEVGVSSEMYEMCRYDYFYVYVYCDECMAQGPQFKYDNSKVGSEKLEEEAHIKAIESWNKKKELNKDE